jgi:O-antigen/teichoic acid export membrane protein
MATRQGGELKKTAKNSSIYAIGTMISRLTGLVMLPIYTRYLTPADYGVLELFSIAIELMGILVGLRITQGMFRYYILEDDPEKKRVIVSTVLFTVVIASGMGSLVLFSGSEPFSLLIFGSADYEFEFQLFAFTLMTNAISAVGLAYIRARRKPVLFISVGIVTLAMQVALNIIFVVMMDMHVRGVVYGALITGSIISFGLVCYVFSGVGYHYSRPIAKKLVSYVAPLVLASLGSFFVAYADKYFIRIFGSLAEVGLYALAMRISSILSTIYQSFNMSWSADRYEIVKRNDANEVFRQVFRFVSVLLIMVGVGLSVFANDFFRVMTNPEFYSAGDIVPILILAVLARLFTMFCNFGVMLKERTRYIAESSWIKAVVAIVGYLIFIPYLGVFGAALALLLSNLFEFFWVNKHSTRLYDMTLQWGPVGLMLSAGVLCNVISLLLPAGEWSYFLLRVALFIALLFATYFMPVWHDDDRRLIKSGFRKISAILCRRQP